MKLGKKYEKKNSGHSLLTKNSLYQHIKSQLLDSAVYE